MMQSILLPNRYKVIGWILLIPSFLLGLYLLLFGFEPNWAKAKVLSIFPNNLMGEKGFFKMQEINITQTLIGVLFIIGGLLIMFSKEKIEDEYITKIRLTSLLWAVLINYSLLIVAFVFVYNLAFISVMIFNMFTILIIFIIRFHFLLYKNSKNLVSEK
jgi:hypothetical protein